jgi:superfamily II DNA or RNA helicase
MADVVITERLLMEAGGWQAMKHARALHQMGRVSGAQYRSQLLQGMVRDGQTDYRCGLKIKTMSDIENLCSCRLSRDFGTICAHSLAVGLSWIAPQTPPPPSKPTPSAPVRVAPELVTEGEAPRLELHVVIAPNFAATWPRDQVMTGFEVVQSGRRFLAGALPVGKTFSCTELEKQILESARHLAAGRLPGMLSLSREHFLAVLGLLTGFPRVTLGRDQPVNVSKQPLIPELVATTGADGVLGLATRIGPGQLLVGNETAWHFHENEFHQVAPGLPAPYLSLLKAPIRMQAEEATTFLQKELPALSAFVKTPNLVAAAAVEPGVPEVLATIEGSLNYLAAKLQLRYGKRTVTHGVTSPREDFVYTTEHGSRARNLVFENQSAERLGRAGFQGPGANGDFVLKGERAILNFFAQDLPELQSRWQVSLGSRFQNVSRNLERAQPRLDIVSSGENWFEFTFSLESGQGDRFSAAEVQRLLQSGQSSVSLKNGRKAVFDPHALSEIQAALMDCQPDQVQPGRYRIHSSQAAFLDAAFRELAGGRIAGNSAWDRWTAQQRQLAPLEPVPLGSLADVLREYQKQGVAWMNFIGANALGGILADEMGLGKTLQALAFLSTLPGPSLVVCPASLVFNWQREAQRFVPAMKLLAVEGPDRATKFSRIPKSDLVLTSYPLLRRDVELYRPHEFSAIVLDEANHIKNPDTQNAQAALALRGRHRFVLTGTPVENSVRDLWSLMNFVLPGYLGSREDFRERYELPIARGAPTEGARLARRLRPVMLRRLKKDVVKELPGKIEQVALCELSGAQKELYDKLHREGRRKVESLEGKDRGQARMAMLTALLRLRQVCCDLRLLDPNHSARSAKVDLWMELLEEALDGGHRVLVFSQFVTMLQLLRTELERRAIEYAYLDGSTKQRGLEVDRFQQNEGLPVFLISLKAGGVGLNLSAADTVFHFDPWWNPAVEDQATDRAHRIGQTRVVTSYKLIARNTVEEKILRLQEKKRAVMEATVDSEEPLMTGLSLEEIAGLLS